MLLCAHIPSKGFSIKGLTLTEIIETLILVGVANFLTFLNPETFLSSSGYGQNCAH